MNSAVARFALGLLVMSCLLIASTRADDIDIYHHRYYDGSPHKVVLNLDVLGVRQLGMTEEFRAALLVAIEQFAAFQVRQPGRPAVEVSLLAPPMQGCEIADACSVTDWTLGGFLTPADPDQKATLQAQLDQLLLVSEEFTGTHSYSLGDGYSLLEQELDLASCETIDVVHLLFEASALHPDSEAPYGRPWLRSHFVVGSAATDVTDLAEALGAEVHLLQDVAGLKDTLSLIFTVPQQRPTTLLSASVPAFSAGATGDTDEVLFPLFSPGPGSPWPGNLKKLKLVTTENGVVFAQAPLGRPPVSAMDPVDGAIRRDALTFWTDPLGFDVQDFDPARGEVRGKDGRSVTRGGAGQAVPGYLSGAVSMSNSQFGARQLFTLPQQRGEQLIPLNADLETEQLLRDELEAPGVEALGLLRFIRGADAFDADGDGDLLEPRSWLMGSVMHSQPIIINYGPRAGYSVGNPDVRILFGSNDGFLRMLTNAEAGWGDWSAGREVWAIMPREILGQQVAGAGFGSQLPPGYLYGVDGSPAIHRLDINRDGLIDPSAGDRVWVFFGLRRGGKSYYALDISDPDNPVLMWRLSPEIDGFDQLALGFSTPRVVRMDLGGDRPQWVLLLAAGYNGGFASGATIGKDAGSEEDARGNAIYVVDAATGELLWRAVGPGAVTSDSLAEVTHRVSQMKHSIPAPVTPIDSDGNGLVDRAYVADTGGVLWRLDMPGAGAGFTASRQELVASWRVRPLAELGGSAEHDRRFFHAVDVTRTRDALGDYDGVALVSGNRARPGETLVRNYAYLVKDRGQTNPTAHEQLADVGVLCRLANSEGCAEADLGLGWKIALEAPGEKGLSRPLIRSGLVLFSSYHPPEVKPDSCEPGLGSASVYSVKLRNGSPAMRQLYRPLDEDDTPLIEEESRFFAVGEGIPGPVIPWRDQLILPGDGLEGERILKPRGPRRWRIYWRENGVDVP